MNPRFDTSKGSESIRSDINSTRRRMDGTIDALAARFTGRHLLDEALELFRSHRGNGNPQLREKLTDSAGSAVQAIGDTVRRHPVPTLLIGAGIAWMFYDKRREERRDEAAPDLTSSDSLEYRPETVAPPTPRDYPSPASAVPPSSAVPGGSSPGGEPARDARGMGGISGEQEPGRDRDSGKIEKAKAMITEKTSAASQRIQNTMSQAGHRAREGAEMVRERASDLTGRAQDRARSAYRRSRETIGTTMDEHPLEVGIACLALGVIAGLAMPTPAKLDEVVGPAADRLRESARDKGREALERGRQVVRAATSAAREEARAQGLTPEELREKGEAVAQEARQAGMEAARAEGRPGSGSPPAPGAPPAEPPPGF